MSDEAPFSFPAHMPRAEAQRILQEAYESLDTGRMLRRALKIQRDEGFDPPHDVQYVGEPHLEDYEEGLGVALHADIMVHEEFEGIDDCVGIFDEVLGQELMDAVEKRVRKWAKRNPAP